MRVMNLTLKTKLLLTIGTVLLLSFLVLTGVNYRNLHRDIVSDRVKEARDIRGMLMATRRVYHHQFLESDVPLTDKTLGFLPAHALGNISRDFPNWSDSGMSFNNVSDRPRNPRNTADEVELAAIEHFRQHPQTKERMVPFIDKAGRSYYHFSMPIYMEKYCLKCHGPKEDAPPAIQSRYDTSFDYQVGDLRGIVSIKLPVDEILTTVHRNTLENGIVQLFTFLVAFFAIFWLLHKTLLSRMQGLLVATKKVADSNYDVHVSRSGQDELDQVSASFNQMAAIVSKREKALLIAHDKLEMRVKKRTADLTKANEALRAEITERKRVEKELLSEKQLIEEYVNSLPGLFYVFDEQRFARWNTEWNRVTGYSDMELGSKYGTDFFEGEDKVLVGEQMLKVFREGVAESEAELMTKDGRRIPYYFTGLRKKVKGRYYLIGLGIDITERKQMEDALREANEEMESRVKDRTRELSLLNENLQQEVGERMQTQEALTCTLLDQKIITSILKLSLQPFPLNEILRQSLVLVLQKHGIGLSLQGCVFLVDQKTEELVMEVRHGLPDSIIDSCGRLPFGRCLCGMAAQSGKVIHADRIDGRHEHTYTGIEPHGHYCVPIKDELGMLGVLNLYLPEGHQHSEEEEQFVLAIAHTMASVVRRRRAEEALRKSEANLVEAQRIAHLGSWDWDIVRNDLSWSDEIYRIFGISSRQFGATYESFLSHVHQTDREMVKEAVNAALYQQQSYNIEHRIIRLDGVERSVHERAQVVFDADNSPLRMVGTVQDVTEHKQAKVARRRLKEELEKKERERLAALLHDGVGQNLQAINLGLRMVAEDMAKPAAVEILPELVEEVRKTIDQVRDLNEELSPVNLEHMDLAEAVRSHASKLTVRVKANIFVNTNGDSYAFLSDRVKELSFLIFQEALTNAIKHSGAEKIMVQLKVVGDNWLIMQISDDGCGFSTKQTTGEGKGLGLSIIKERAARLGGTANVRSEPGKGTTVTMKIPIS